jgi:hypothetical protein
MVNKVIRSSRETFFKRLISHPQYGNFIGSKESPFLRIGFALGQRVPLLVESKTISSSIVVVVKLSVELDINCFIYM